MAGADEPWWYISLEERAALVGALGGITFGYDIGVISGALVSLKGDFGLDDQAEGMVVAMIAVGQIPGAVIGGLVTDQMGRRFAIFVQNACYLAGTLLTAYATSLEQLVCGQLVVGVGVAFSVTSNISYVTEMVGPQRAGAMVATYELATTFGVLLAYLVFLGVGAGEDAWRTMFLCGLTFPLLQALAVYPMPESPVWLFSKGRVGAARRALLALHDEGPKARPRAKRAPGDAGDSGAGYGRYGGSG
eukprot:CAMPEP_0172596520 /NCGR_PEP_ID=MMETSP1068-20121228/16338_1 /TAXON_ID=35684 /ORGANISM="Pseudopedinella elastica, Strain CCMP716" /LENGTH=246 /DNA_ID=CAMNT_0013395597 /DNA_START=23 /DNA_END=760 /DNA_ORIENTATION=+